MVWMSRSGQLGTRRWWGYQWVQATWGVKGVHILFPLPGVSVPDQPMLSPLLSPLLELLLILHGPTYMTFVESPSQGSLWLLEFLGSNPVHYVLLACLLCVPATSPELGSWRGWADILFIFVPLRPSSLSWSSVNIYGSVIFSLHSEIGLYKSLTPSCEFFSYPNPFLPYLKVNTLLNFMNFSSFSIILAYLCSPIFLCTLLHFPAPSCRLGRVMWLDLAKEMLV